ncbi:unnamed protein product [Auanema sp. JU1783]|nr:unnamed protein product [Auanema sp. JU1783]
MDFVRMICCCTVNEDDNFAPYERLQESNVTSVRNRQEGYTNGGSDYVDRAQATSKDAAEQQVQEQYSRILDSTQNSIIDLSHLDGARLPTSDYISRARRYEECISSHDNRVAKNNSFSSKPYAGGILSDSSNRVADYLGRPAISSNVLSMVLEFASKAENAVEAIQISNKEDLVAHMDF